MTMGSLVRPAALALLCACDSGFEPLRGRYNLFFVNNAAIPAQYYVDPGGTFYAIADSGYLNVFGPDSVSSTRYLTLVYTPGGSSPASAYELIRYVRAGETLILYHGVTPDTATVIAGTITAHRTDGSGTDLGYWTYVKQ